MMAKLNGSPLSRTEGERMICLTNGPKLSSEFVYIAINAVPMISVLRQVSANRPTFTQGNFRSGASSNNISAGESNELSMEPLMFLQRLQVLAGFEANGFSGWDIHFRTGARIP